MKKILYFVLLVAELFVGTLLMMGLWNSSLYVPMAIAVAAVVGLFIWQIIRFKKATEPAAKKTILSNIAIIFLIPTAVYFITYIVVAIAMIIAFV